MMRKTPSVLSVSFPIRVRGTGGVSDALWVRRMNVRSFACILLVVLPGLSIAQSTPSTLPFSQLSAKADAARDANRLGEAVTLYRKALAQRPGWKEGWWSLATILYDQNSYSPAARAFAKVIALDPKNGTAHLFLGLCQYQLNQDDRAITNLTSARRLGIQNADQLERVLQYHEGMLLLRKRDFERAIDSFKGLVELGVKSEDLDLALGLSVLLMQPSELPAEGTSERQVIVRAGRAEQFVLLKKYEDAERAYTALTQEFPDFRNVHYALGRFFLAAQEPEKAVPQFEEEIKRNPKHIRARMQIAATKYRVDSAAGIPYAAEVVRLEPSYPFGHYMLGLLRFDSGDTQGAIPELETAARMVPGEAQFLFVLGNAYAKAGRKQDAARVRAAYRKLGNAAQSGSQATTYGGQNSVLDNAGGPQSAEKDQH